MAEWLKARTAAGSHNVNRHQPFCHQVIQPFSHSAIHIQPFSHYRDLHIASDTAGQTAVGCPASERP
jgi:hypothetical protein